MSTSALRTPASLDLDGFLRFLDAQPNKRWELHEGAPTEMVRPTFAHAVVVSNILVHLLGPARARGFATVTEFLIEADPWSGYAPDVAVVRGTLEPASRRSREPVIAFEVLSPSTMDFDRSAKARGYKAISSLQQLVFVYQDSVRIESWTRREDAKWPPGPQVLVRREDTLALPAIGGSLPLAEAYAGLVPSPFDGDAEG